MSINNRLVSWYASRSALPYWCVLLLDILFVFISGLVSCVIFMGGYNTLVNFWPTVGTILFYTIFYVIGFKLFHTYSGILRYSSFVDLQRVAGAVAVGLVLSLCVQQLNDEFQILPFLRRLRIAAILFSAGLTIILMWAARIWGKILYEGFSQRDRSIRVFIYGTKEGGVAIAKNIKSQPHSPYIVAGFVSDDPRMLDKRLMGVRIYPNDVDLVGAMNRENVSTIIVSPLKTEFMTIHEEWVNRLMDHDKHIMVFPQAREWDGKSELQLNQLRDVNLEDLLPRETIEIDMEAVGRQLSGKRIMITGAAGSIGSEIVRQVAGYSPASLILIDQAETPLHDIRLYMAKNWPDIEAHTIVADIANAERMRDIFSRLKPEYVFHAAAYKHVPMMEDNPNESIVNNVKGTCIVADLAVEFGTKKFVMVSTDKAVNPTNVMGCSKRICEIYVQSLDKALKEGKVAGETQFVTTRFGNVLGSNGSVIPLFKEQIKQGGPVTVTHPEIIRYFMLIPEACKLVLEAGTMGNGGEIFVFDMGKPVKIADLARRMIRLSGAKNVEIKFTGLRDGEKLYEEVLSDAEQTKPTFHPKIKIATVREYEYSAVQREIEDMIKSSLTDDAMAVVARMKALVPEFRSQHSIYETLDCPNNVTAVN